MKKFKILRNDSLYEKQVSLKEVTNGRGKVKEGS
jgi:hypothetical protein